MEDPRYECIVALVIDDEMHPTMRDQVKQQDITNAQITR